MRLLKVFVAVLMFEFGTSQILPDVEYYRSVLRETREVSSQCSAQMDAYVSGLTNNASWAWNIFDAQPKIPYGFLTGNLLDAGNYDECLRANVIDVEGEILGKFCRNALAVVLPIHLTIEGQEAATTRERKSPLGNNLTLSRSSFPMEPETGLRILILSVCIPNACTTAEMLEFLYISSFGLPIIPLEDAVCETVKDLNEFTNADLGFVIFISIIVGLVLICTIYDELIRDKTRPVNPLFVSFSFTGNFKKILEKTDNKNRISCLDGLRVFSIFWVILGHRYSISEILPFVNKDYSLIWVEKLYTQYVQGAPIAVDTFMFITGLLMAMSFIRTQSSRNSKFNLVLYYIHRYLRLTPALAVVYFLHVSVFLHFGSGPYWTYITHRTRENCLNRWSSFFFYYQNYLDYNDMCLLHTWYLSMDMQIFLASPLVLLPLAKHRKMMMRAGMPILILLSIAGPFLVTYVNETQILSDAYYVYYYYPTHTRLSAWLVGVYSGAIIHALRNVRLTIHPIFNLSIWTIVVAGMTACILCGNHLTYNYDRLATSFYISFHRPAWCVGLAWIVFACMKGRGGIFEHVLSSDLLQTLSKVSYSMYLVHITWLLLSVGTTRYPGHFNDKDTLHLVAGDVVITTALAFIWSVLFESPMISIERFIFGGTAKPKDKAESKPIDIQEVKVEESSEQPQYYQARQTNGDNQGRAENGSITSFKFNDDVSKTSIKETETDDMEIETKGASQSDAEINSLNIEKEYRVDPFVRSMGTYEFQNEYDGEIKYEDVDKNELTNGSIGSFKFSDDASKTSTKETEADEFEEKGTSQRDAEINSLNTEREYKVDPFIRSMGTNELQDEYDGEIKYEDVDKDKLANGSISSFKFNDDASKTSTKETEADNIEIEEKSSSQIDAEINSLNIEREYTVDPFVRSMSTYESQNGEVKYEDVDKNELAAKNAYDTEIKSNEMSEPTTQDNHALEAEVRNAESLTLEDVSNSNDIKNKNQNLL